MNKIERSCFKKLHLYGRKTFKERLLYWLKGFKNKNFGYSLLLMIDIIFIAIPITIISIILIILCFIPHKVYEYLINKLL